MDITLPAEQPARAEEIARRTAKTPETDAYVAAERPTWPNYRLVVRIADHHVMAFCHIKQSEGGELDVTHLQVPGF